MRSDAALPARTSCRGNLPEPSGIRVTGRPVQPAGGLAAGGDTADRILCRLCRRGYKAVSWSHLHYRHQLTNEEYREAFPDAPMVSLELKQSVRERLIAHLERQGRRWSRKRVRREILKHGRAGKPLNPRAASQAWMALYRAACRNFGSWRKALRAVGLDPNEINLSKRWNRKAIISALREKQAAGNIFHGSRFGARSSSLVAAAQRHFGSWHSALRAAHIVPPGVEHLKWTKARVLAQVARRYERGRSLLQSAVARDSQALIRAARRLFKKPWSDFVRSRGYPYGGRRRWTRKKAITELRRLRDNGTRLSSYGVQKVDASLYISAKRLFGSWAKTLKAANVDPPARSQPYWTQDRVKDLIKQRHMQRRPLNAKAVIAGCGSLYGSAQRLFGSWECALRACSIEPNSVYLRRRWNREKILSMVRAFHAKGQFTVGSHFHDRQRPLIQAAKATFGNWRSALKAAGVAPLRRSARA